MSVSNSNSHPITIDADYAQIAAQLAAEWKFASATQAIQYLLLREWVCDRTAKERATRSKPIQSPLPESSLDPGRQFHDSNRMDFTKEWEAL